MSVHSIFYHYAIIYGSAKVRILLRSPRFRNIYMYLEYWKALFIFWGQVGVLSPHLKSNFVFP